MPPIAEGEFGKGFLGKWSCTSPYVEPFHLTLCFRWCSNSSKSFLLVSRKKSNSSSLQSSGISKFFPKFASLSVSSFPKTPWCPVTQSRITEMYVFDTQIRSLMDAEMQSMLCMRVLEIFCGIHKLLCNSLLLVAVCRPQNLLLI